MIAAIILAAGNSRRMGTQKLLLPVDGKPVIARVVEAVGACGGIDEILVVVGRDGGRIRDALARSGVRFAATPDPDGEMLASIRCGLRALPAALDAFLVVLGDQPGITPELIARLLDAGRDAGETITVPVADGRRGHPVLICASHRGEIMDHFDGIGLRGLLAAHPRHVRDVPVSADDAHQLRDMDTPDDYAGIAAAH